MEKLSVMVNPLLQNAKRSPYAKHLYAYRSRLMILRLRREVVAMHTKPTSIFILGMHRSGTSCLTGMLSQCGVYLGAVSQYNPRNKKGNQEGKATWLNDELLRVNGGTWYRPTKIEVIPQHIALQIEQCYLQILVEAYQDHKTYWGIKDPKMLFCLPAWLDKSAIFIGTIRHPANVVSSLLNRTKHYAEQKGDPWELWYQYNRELVSLYHRQPFPIVNFDWEPARYSAAFRNIALHIGLDYSEGDFFEENLIHHVSTDEIPNPAYRNLYQELVHIAEIEEAKLASSYTI